MICQECGTICFEEDRRMLSDATIRRYKCSGCGHEFTTREVVVSDVKPVDASDPH